ncbi:DNA-binding response regulator [Paenibacillus sp. 598K]|uniref:response regulator n=1 Tax=Paenibacillus sp. 598K TaxID=1117987 RepID=UPI000FFA0440|nr:response regulator [Paenibacillus sp. 598K]GBF74519.1 DNA-binding response regulator [Paenibacillus sp. 598K]
MYKVMIVDDEYYIRLDIRAMLDWESLGFRLTEDAVNGEDALAKLEKERPDIILLDIGMPGMGGIELLSQLRQREFAGWTLVLSCHDEFDYVKDALLLGAQNYLLKHKLEPKMLEETLLKMVEHLEGERRHSEQVIRWQSIAALSLQEQRKQFIRQLVHGAYSTSGAVLGRMKQLELGFPVRQLIVLLAKLHPGMMLQPEIGFRKSHAQNEQIAEAVNREALTPETGFCFAENEEELVLVIGFDPAPGFLHIQSLLYDLVNRVQGFVRQRFDIDMSIGVSNGNSSPAQLPESCRQARSALEGVYYLGKNRIISFSEVSDYTAKPEKSFREYEQALLRELANDSRIAAIINDMYAALVEQKVALAEARAFTFEFVSFLKKQQREHGITDSELFEAGHSPYEAVGRTETVEETQAYLIRVTIRLSELISIASKQKYRPEIANAIRYMKEHFSDELSLDTVAANVGMNATYFSNLFKKETGQNFVAFLQRIRMENAKTLLRTTHDKVYDVASQVGIDNYHYFCKTFKQVTGMTPLQYRSKARQ